MDALILVTVDTQKRKIAHRLEEHRDGTEILAKSPVILEGQGQCDTRNVIERISGEEQPEHDLLQICDLHQKHPGHQYQGQNEHHIAKNTNFFLSRLLRLLIGQKIQHHGRPAGISTPTTPEQQRSKYFYYRVVDSRSFKNTEEQIVPEALNLHILVGDHAEVQQHIAADRQLHKMPGIAFPGSKECRPQCEAAAYVTEIQQIKQVVLCKPQRDCHHFKQQKQQDRHKIF